MRLEFCRWNWNFVGEIWWILNFIDEIWILSVKLDEIWILSVKLEFYRWNSMKFWIVSVKLGDIWILSMKFEFYRWNLVKFGEIWCFPLRSRGASCAPTRMEPWNARTTGVSSSEPGYSHLEKIREAPKGIQLLTFFPEKNSLFGASMERKLFPAWARVGVKTSPKNWDFGVFWSHRNRSRPVGSQWDPGPIPKVFPCGIFLRIFCWESSGFPWIRAPGSMNKLHFSQKPHFFRKVSAMERVGLGEILGMLSVTGRNSKDLQGWINL